MDLVNRNTALKMKSPAEIIQWALKDSKKPVVTTNFRPYEVAILHAVTSIRNDLQVIWCDTGYNTPATYRHAEYVIKKLNLNIDIYVPKQSAAHRDVVLGIPNVEDPRHVIFSEQVKLEPFRRAMKEHAPDLWFTNLRNGQTDFRNSIDILSQDKNGLLKVSPFYYWSDLELDNYLEENDLENEFQYFDPTKQLENRECGLHN